RRRSRRRPGPGVRLLRWGGRRRPGSRRRLHRSDRTGGGCRVGAEAPDDDRSGGCRRPIGATPMIKRGKPARGSAALATIDDRHVISAYARWAPIYDASFGLITRGAQKAAVAEVNRLPAGRILEVGVGTGISLPLYDRKHRVVGVDLSPEML